MGSSTKSMITILSSGKKATIRTKQNYVVVSQSAVTLIFMKVAMIRILYSICAARTIIKIRRLLQYKDVLKASAEMFWIQQHNWQCSYCMVRSQNSFRACCIDNTSLVCRQFHVFSISVVTGPLVSELKCFQLLVEVQLFKNLREIIMGQ